jgi:hypothetical protein
LANRNPNGKAEVNAFFTPKAINSPDFPLFTESQQQYMNIGKTSFGLFSIDA